jgi:hypothetical protein
MKETGLIDVGDRGVTNGSEVSAAGWAKSRPFHPGHGDCSLPCSSCVTVWGSSPTSCSGSSSRKRVNKRVFKKPSCSGVMGRVSGSGGSHQEKKISCGKPGYPQPADSHVKIGRVMLGGLICRLFLFVILIFSAWGMTGNAGAVSTYQSILCNNKVVSLGDTKEEVFVKCGEPLSISSDEVVERFESFPRVRRTKRVERWTYKIGGFYRVFVFEGGELERIEAGSLAD